MLVTNSPRLVLLMMSSGVFCPRLQHEVTRSRPRARGPRRACGALHVELARTVGVEQIRLELALLDHHVTPRRQSVAVERPRARPRLNQRIIHDRDEIARHVGAQTIEQIARTAVNAVADDAPGQRADERSRRIRFEHHRNVRGRYFARAKQRNRSPGSLPPDGLFALELRKHTPRRPVSSRAVLSRLRPLRRAAR